MIFVVGVARKVEWADAGEVGAAVADDFGAFAGESVDCVDDVDFVAGDGAGAEDDDVGRFDFDEFMRAGHHAVEDSV